MGYASYAPIEGGSGLVTPSASVVTELSVVPIPSRNEFAAGCQSPNWDIQLAYPSGSSIGLGQSPTSCTPCAGANPVFVNRAMVLSVPSVMARSAS